MEVKSVDGDKTEFTVGYEKITTEDGDTPMFWIETNLETVTLVLDKKQLTHLISTLQFLKDTAR